MGIQAVLMSQAVNLICKKNWEQLFGSEELKMQFELFWGRNIKTVDKNKLFGIAVLTPHRLCILMIKASVHFSAHISVLQNLHFTMEDFVFLFLLSALSTNTCQHFH